MMNDDNASKLHYVLSPAAVRANTRVSFTLVATNGAASLQLTPNDEIYLAVPVGSGATDLTPDLNDIGTQAPANWRFSKTVAGGQYNFLISPTQNVTLNANASLLFELNTVIINPLQGNAQIGLEEFIGDGSGKASFDVSKSEAVLSIVAQAIPSTVGRNQTTVLKWTAAKAAYVTISPLNKTVDTVGQLVTTPSKDITPEAPQVLYSFTAWTPDQQFARDIVAVTISPPVILDFEPQHQSPIAYNDQVTLRWDVVYAETVMLTLPQGLVQKPVSGELKVQPKTMLQGNEDTATYTLRATGAGKPVFASVDIPFKPVAIDYFRYPDFETTNSYEFNVTNGSSQVDQLIGPQGQYYRLTAAGPNGPRVQYLGNYAALQIQVFIYSAAAGSGGNSGTQVKLQWKTCYAAAMSLIADGRSTPIAADQLARGSITVSLTQTTQYVLSASDSSGNVVTSALLVNISGK
jgi:hypothetical protein